MAAAKEGKRSGLRGDQYIATLSVECPKRSVGGRLDFSLHSDMSAEFRSKHCALQRLWRDELGTRRRPEPLTLKSVQWGFSFCSSCSIALLICLGRDDASK